jgi:membrane protease subunit HflK
MYLDAMQQIYSNVTKVVIDSKQGSNLMYLPLDKLIQMTGTPLTVTAPVDVPANNAATSTAPSSAPPDPRSRDSLRSRDRENR